MIKKFQQGGQQDAIMQFVQGLAETLQADPQQIVQIAQQNPDALKSAVQVYQETQDIQKAAQAFVQATKQQAQRAAHGAKLQYLKTLKNKCEEGEELVYYKQGGSVKCGCMPKKEESGGEIPENPVKRFRKAQKSIQDNVKKVKDKASERVDKNLEKTEITYDPKTKKTRPATKEEIRQRAENRRLSTQGKGEGNYIQGYKCGDSVKKFKKHYNGGSLKHIPFMQKGTPKKGLRYIPHWYNSVMGILKKPYKPDWYKSTQNRTAFFDKKGDYYEQVDKNSLKGDNFRRLIFTKYSQSPIEEDTIYMYHPAIGEPEIEDSKYLLTDENKERYKKLKNNFDKIVSIPTNFE